MLKPKSVVENAKTELGNTIITYLRKLDAFISTGNKRMMTAPEQDIIITENEVLGDMPEVRVEVDDSYLDVEDTIYEYLPIDKIVLSEGELYFEVGDADIYVEDLDVEELAVIAGFLIGEYEKCE